MGLFCLYLIMRTLLCNTMLFLTSILQAQTKQTIRDIDKLVVYRHLDYVCPGDSCWRGDTLHFWGRNIYTVKGDTGYKITLGKEKAQWLAKQLSKPNYFDNSGEVGTPLYDYSIFFYDKNNKLVTCELFGFDEAKGSNGNDVKLARGMLKDKVFNNVLRFFKENEITHPKTIHVCMRCRK